MNLSNRIMKMHESPIRKLLPIADKAKASGKKVYHLNIGQPDIPTPKEFFNAIKNFDEPVLKYAVSHGIPELRQTISNYYHSNNMDYDIDDILITSGGSEALLFSLMALCDENDEILVPEPFYTNYYGFTLPIGVKISPITTNAYDGFRLPSKEKIETLITEKTRAFLISNPGNPTGVLYTDEEINMIAQIAKEHNLFIIADEVYREFIFDNLSYTSFGSIDEITDNVILVDSISKRYSACGARIGYLASKNKILMAQMLKLCQMRLCAPMLEQIGANELYKKSKSYFKSISNEYESRRNVVFNALSNMKGVVCKEPKGAFYTIVKLPIDDANNFAKWILESFDINGETILLAPAEKFYITKGLGKDEVRIAYVLNKNDLQKAMNILKLALDQYPKRT